MAMEYVHAHVMYVRVMRMDRDGWEGMDNPMHACVPLSDTMGAVGACHDCVVYA